MRGTQRGTQRGHKARARWPAGKKKGKLAFKERIQAVEYSRDVGKSKYSKEHLYTCREVLKAYKNWADPKSRKDQKATVPKEVRHFVDRYLADEDASILSAYDLPHVKKSQSEKRHVTFCSIKWGSWGQRWRMNAFNAQEWRWTSTTG